MKRQVHRKRCVVIGGGGHAKMVIESLRLAGDFEPCAVLDRRMLTRGEEVSGVPVWGDDRLIADVRRRGIRYFAVGLGSVGDPGPRRRLFEQALAAGLEPATVIHPSAVCSSLVDLEAGVQLLPACVVNAGARIGANTIVNSGAIVEHDCVVGAHVHIATGAVLAGAVQVGWGAHIGAGAVVRQQICIGCEAVVGAGAVVVKNVSSGDVVAGVPARPLRRTRTATLREGKQ